MKEFEHDVSGVKVKIWECETCGKKSNDSNDIFICERDHKRVNCTHTTLWYDQVYDDYLDSWYLDEIYKTCKICGEILGKVQWNATENELQQVYELLENLQRPIDKPT